MQTTPTRVPEAVHGEVQAAARLLGCDASELLERAWNSFRQSAEFGEELARAQKAFATGDLGAVASMLQDRATQRARQRAGAVRGLRRG